MFPIEIPNYYCELLPFMPTRQQSSSINEKSLSGDTKIRRFHINTFAICRALRSIIARTVRREPKTSKHQTFIDNRLQNRSPTDYLVFVFNIPTITKRRFIYIYFVVFFHKIKIGFKFFAQKKVIFAAS